MPDSLCLSLLPLYCTACAASILVQFGCSSSSPPALPPASPPLLSFTPPPPSPHLWSSTWMRLLMTSVGYTDSQKQPPPTPPASSSDPRLSWEVSEPPAISWTRREGEGGGGGGQGGRETLRECKKVPRSVCKPLYPATSSSASTRRGERLSWGLLRRETAQMGSEYTTMW